MQKRQNNAQGETGYMTNSTIRWSSQFFETGYVWQPLALNCPCYCATQFLKCFFPLSPFANSRALWTPDMWHVGGGQSPMVVCNLFLLDFAPKLYITPPQFFSEHSSVFNNELEGLIFFSSGKLDAQRLCDSAFDFAFCCRAGPLIPSQSKWLFFPCSLQMCLMGKLLFASPLHTQLSVTPDLGSAWYREIAAVIWKSCAYLSAILMSSLKKSKGC